MQKRITGIIFLSILPVFLGYGFLFGQQAYPELNQALKYRVENNIGMNYQVTRSGKVHTVIFSLDLPSGENLNNDYDLSYEIKDEYGKSSSLITRTLNQAIAGIGTEGSKIYLKVRFEDQENYNVLFLRLVNKYSSVVHVWDIPLDEANAYEAPDFYLTRSKISIPYLLPYIEIGDDLKIASMDSTINSFFVYHYEHTFSPADPPMSRLDKEVSRSMEIDTIFMVRGNEPFTLSKQGLYFIQSDTSSFSGISIRAEEKFYPKLVRIEDIADPVIYLTTKQEIDKLKAAEDKKKAFEKFWLNLANSEERAGRMIRIYFNEVENANRFFTNYKPGWKTDMGMIYILFGPPDDVTNNGETESWQYNAQDGNLPVVFNFLHLKSIFTNQHYLLIRDKRYRNIWFRKIEDWRVGRINR